MSSPKSILTHIWCLTSVNFGPWERAVLGTVLVKTRKLPHWTLAKGKVTDSACTHIKHIYLRPRTWLDCPEGHTSKLRAAEKRGEEKRSINVSQNRVEKTQQPHFMFSSKLQNPAKSNNLYALQYSSLPSNLWLVHRPLALALKLVLFL